MYSDFPESNDTGTPPITLFWVVKTFVAALAAALSGGQYLGDRLLPR